MKFIDWIRDEDLLLDDKYSKLEKVKVLFEFKRHEECTWVEWSNFSKHKNVHNWVLLSTGYVVGLNENPARGISYPIKKLSIDDFALCVNQAYIMYRKLKYNKRFLDSLEDFDLDGIIEFENVKYTIADIISEVSENTILGNSIRIAIEDKTIELLK